MVVNGREETEKEVCLTTGQKCSAVSNSVSLDQDAAFVNNNSDVFSLNDNQADEFVPTDVKYEIEDKCSIDDDNFELRIINDDDNEISEMKFDSKLDEDGAEYLSATVNNEEDDDEVEKSRTITTFSATDSRTSRTLALFDCVWCKKQFSTKKSLKYHVLSHLRALKHDVKDSYLASTSEVDDSAMDNTYRNGSFDFVCVFCEKSFSTKKFVIAHYITVHHLSDSQLQNRSKKSALNGPYWQSSENKIPDAATSAPIISSAAEESLETLNIDENVVNEDGSKQYKCYICDKQFARNSSLMWHIQFHETYKYPKMEKNNIESDLPSSLVVDMDETGTTDGVIEEHDDNINVSCASNQFVCNICDSHFSHRNGYLRHMNSAHQIIDDEIAPVRRQTSGHQCESCGRFFSTSSNMRKHARKHCKGGAIVTGESEENEEDEDACDDPSEDPLKEFICDVCHRSFISQRALSIHRSFKHRDDMSDAVEDDTRTEDLIPCDSYIENEDGSFQCTVGLCDKTFETRKGVIRHIGYHRSAANETIQASPACTDGTSDDDSDNDEEGNCIPCPQCGKTFGSIRGMRIHANKHVEKSANGEDIADSDGDEKNKSSYECNICNKTFQGFRSFKIHIGWHSRREETPEKSIPPPKPSLSGSSKIYQCQHCPRWYTTQQALAGHMKVHQSLKAGTPQGSGQLEDQISEQKTDRVCTCQVCAQNFSNNVDLSSHMQLHLGEANPTTSSGQPLTLEDTMECDTCGKSFMHKQDMAKHMRDHINGTVTKENVDLTLFCCIHCNKSFVGRKSLITHQKLHKEAQVALKRAANQMSTDVTPAKLRRPSDSAAAAPGDSLGWESMMQGHQCKKCDRILSTKQSLYRHMEWHTRMMDANGPNTLSAKETKMATAAPPSQQKEIAGIPYDCLRCKKSFRSKELLLEHNCVQEDVPDEEPQTVVVNDLEALGEHAVVQCVEGGNEEYFVFDQREGEAFQCSECDETHFDKLQMIVHMAYHVGKRWANGRQKALIIKASPIMLAPFECKFCDERFVNKVFRNRHVVKRHGNKVVQCNTCKKAFLSKTRLTVHCRQHYSDSPYRCERCMKCFTSKWFLKRHARTNCVGESSQEIKEVEYELIFS